MPTPRTIAQMANIVIGNQLSDVAVTSITPVAPAGTAGLYILVPPSLQNCIYCRRSFLKKVIWIGCPFFRIPSRYLPDGFLIGPIDILYLNMPKINEARLNQRIVINTLQKMKDILFPTRKRNSIFYLLSVMSDAIDLFCRL